MAEAPPKPKPNQPTEPSIPAPALQTIPKLKEDNDKEKFNWS